MLLNFMPPDVMLANVSATLVPMPRPFIVRERLSVPLSVIEMPLPIALARQLIAATQSQRASALDVPPALMKAILLVTGLGLGIVPRDTEVTRPRAPQSMIAVTSIVH